MMTDKQIHELLASMSLEEKLGEMTQMAPNFFGTEDSVDLTGPMKAMNLRPEDVSCLGSTLNAFGAEKLIQMQKEHMARQPHHIPLMFMADVIHGLKTVYPIPLAMGCSFDTGLMEETAAMAARESAVTGVHLTFSPMADLVRDPRWGRVMESPGEDPLLGARMTQATVKGYQGDSLNDPTSIAACPKHFVGYGATEGGRDYNSTFIPERRLRNVYLPPFEAAAKAGAATFMTSFNDNDGVPGTANEFVLKDILRDEWKFDGLVVTDWNSAGEMINHGFCTDGKDAAEKSVNAGVDMDMVSETFIKNLKQSLDEGKVQMQAIEDAVRNILRLKFRMGLFDNPYVDVPEVSVKYAEAHLQAAKEAAEQSVILMKNDSRTLPFTDKVRTLLVTGPMADTPYEQLGTWIFDGEKEHTSTPLTAIREMYGDKVNVVYEPGLGYSRDNNLQGITRAVDAARRADAVVALVGEEAVLSGEGHSLANLELQGAQRRLIKALSDTGKPLVTVVMAGRPLVITEEVEASDALLYSFHPGTMGGPAIADILFGKVNPSAKTPLTFPRMNGQVPIYYAHNNTGRPAKPDEMLIEDIPVGAGQTSVGGRSFYLDAGATPLFPFGYGLSYTNFEYSDLKLASNKLTVGDEIKVSVSLKNTGDYDGTEVVQLYVQDKVGSVTRPVKELKAFQRVELKAGESKEVTFTLPVSELAFWRYDMTYGVEPGDFKLWVGTNSAEGLNAEFSVAE